MKLIIFMDAETNNKTVEAVLHMYKGQLENKFTVHIFCVVIRTVQI